MTKVYLIIIIAFLIVKLFTVITFKNVYYYYGDVATQFAIAEAAYHGHWLAQDQTLFLAAMEAAAQKQSYLPLNQWKNFPASGRYTTFPALDLPGFGYLIALTSKALGSELTSTYAFIIQIAVELLSLLMFVTCIYYVLDENIALIAGLLYVFAYPFIWPLASQPMRDIFVMAIYACYLSALTIISREANLPAFLKASGLLVVAAVLLWIRPSGYFFFFFVAPFVLFLRDLKIKPRLAFVLLSVLIPLALFGLPLKKFNQHYYGRAETDFIGRGLWEGMGIIQNNPYGFVLQDEALVPWAKSQGHDYEYASPELNKLLGDYARKVIEEDPAFYAKTVLRRIGMMAKSPLTILLPELGEKKFSEYGLGIKEFALQHPLIFLYKTFLSIYPRLFFWGGIICSVFMIIRVQEHKLILSLFLMPALYTMLYQLPLHFDARYMATGAWVFVLPLAYGLASLGKRQARLTP